MDDAAFEDKPRRPVSWPLPELSAPDAEMVLPFLGSGQDAAADSAASDRTIREIDFGALRRPVTRVIVLKLDHHGDFIIGMPALRALRAAFPAAFIRLVCGSWNERAATTSGLFNDVRCFNFFQERPAHGVAGDAAWLREFDVAVEGRFDLAIDLRIDEDTRPLLGRIDAACRAGIGPAGRFPLLDVALAMGHQPRPLQSRFHFLPPENFRTRLPTQGPLHDYGPLQPGEILSGPHTPLPEGKLLVELGLTVRGHLPGLRPASIHVEVFRNGTDRVAARVFGRTRMVQLRHYPISLEFENDDATAVYDFRVKVEGRPARGTVQFSGVTIYQRTTPVASRYVASELHVGERLAMLVSLVQQRVGAIYPPPSGQTAAAGRKPRQRRIAIAPFSNSAVRNWPAEYYVALIELLLQRFVCDVVLLGTPDQLAASRSLTQAIQSPHLVNMVGATNWNELQDVLLSADVVLCNNSGIAHLASSLGATVLAIYSGSHSPEEWGPRGQHSHAISYPVPCSPCGSETLAECGARHECMRKITPEAVLARIEAELVPPGDQGARASSVVTAPA